MKIFRPMFQGDDEVSKTLCAEFDSQGRGNDFNP